jgi:hypothetical protein
MPEVMHQSAYTIFCLPENRRTSCEVEASWDRYSKYIHQSLSWPITVGAPSKAWNGFARSNTGIVDSNPTWGMDIYVRLFCVCAVLRVEVATMRWAHPASKKSYWLCKTSRNSKAAKVQYAKVQKSPLPSESYQYTHVLFLYQQS